MIYTCDISVPDLMIFPNAKLILNSLAHATTNATLMVGPGGLLICRCYPFIIHAHRIDSRMDWISVSEMVLFFSLLSSRQPSFPPIHQIKISTSEKNKELKRHVRRKGKTMPANDFMNIGSTRWADPIPFPIPMRNR